jgi:hypothetical protein
VAKSPCEWSIVSQHIEVHRLGLRMFGATMWKPLIIEPFSQWKLIKIKTENTTRNWKLSWHYWKPLNKSNLIEFISQCSKLRCERYWFSRGFCCWKFKQIAKIGFGRKNQLSPQCVHTWVNHTCCTTKL